MDKVLFSLVEARRQPVAEQIGPKGASLCRLAGAGFAVPDCFFITAECYEQHSRLHGWGIALNECVRSIEANRDQTAEVLCRLRHQIIDSPLDEHFAPALRGCYGQLGCFKVAVRSSATAEDLPGHSFAGQYDTFLDVSNFDELCEAVRKCWASLWTERAFEYRQRTGIDHLAVKMAVIVQRLVAADAAGVAFTLDPQTGSPSRIVIEAVAGLGETLVSGEANPARFRLRKKDLTVTHLNEVAASEQFFHIKTIKRLGRLCRRIEKTFGSPQDIEWAVHHGKIFLLQSRPTTIQPKEKDWQDRQVWSNLNLGEVAPEVLTPLTWSMMERMFPRLFGSVFRLLGADTQKHPVAGLVSGRLYFNLNFGFAACKPFPFLLGPKLGEAMGGYQNRMYEAGLLDIPEEDVPDVGFSWPRYILSWPRLVYDLISHSPKQGARLLHKCGQFNDALERIDTATMNPGQLIDRLSGVTAIFEKWDLLFLITAAPAMVLLDRACRKWLGDDNLSTSAKLFAALGGMADTEAGLDLWRLAEKANEQPDLRDAILGGASWQQIQNRLDADTFIAAWNAFMHRHGHHGRNELELAKARWRETPDYILNLIQGYLKAMDQVNPVQAFEQNAQQRKELTAECIFRLRNPITRFLFQWALHRTQQIAIARENWKNEAVRFTANVRKLLLALGRKVREQGGIDNPDDIFFLTLDELPQLLEPQQLSSLRSTIQTRRQEYSQNISLAPPPVVIGRFDPDQYRAPEIDRTVRTLSGIPSSPGIVTGKARVILDVNDHQQVHPGEILVAPYTDPSWTPYFLTAAGVVVDQGGILSHGSIIAREYGIPAVVNVLHASRIIRTGQRLRVDANIGHVHILDTPPSNNSAS